MYNLIINIISPVFLQLKLKRFIRENVNDDIIAINIGSGNSNISERITNIDIFPYHNVNLCCDIESIPIADDSIDIVINIAVLEHIKNPEKVVDEIHRILKKGGTVFTYFPFMQPFHASPYDYSRRTIEGLKILHKEFDIKEVRIETGQHQVFYGYFRNGYHCYYLLALKKYIIMSI